VLRQFEAANTCAAAPAAKAAEVMLAQWQCKRAVILQKNL
jgi:hypothetical protein